MLDFEVVNCYLDVKVLSIIALVSILYLHAYDYINTKRMSAQKIILVEQLSNNLFDLFIMTWHDPQHSTE